jgi:hypothetical protein
MKRRITRLTVLQTGKLLALLYGFLSMCERRRENVVFLAV